MQSTLTRTLSSRNSNAKVLVHVKKAQGGFLHIYSIAKCSRCSYKMGENTFSGCSYSGPTKLIFVVE